MSWLEGQPRFVPEKRLAFALAAVAPLWLFPGGIGLLAGGAALGIVLMATAIDLVMLPTRGALTVTRNAPSSVGIGEQSLGSYHISSGWPRSIHAEIVDELPEATRGGLTRTTLTLPPFADMRMPFAVRGEVRGRWGLGRVALRLRSRFALVGERLTFSPGDAILVVPSMRGVRRFRILAMQHRLPAIGVRSLRRKGEGHGFAGLRDHAHGDDPRHIDWKATARRRKFITREHTIERSQTLLTMIDAGRGMTQLASGYPRFEHALSSALVLTDIAVAAGDRAGTLAFDDEIRAFAPAQRSRGALNVVRDVLLPVVASPREPDYAGAFRFLAARQRKRSLVVFFTDVIDVHASRALLAHAEHSAVKHLTVVVALRNDDIFEAASSRETDTPRIYERAAAEEMIRARDEGLARMRRTGVVVLDVSPRHMTTAVVNRYLELKSRGVL